MHEHSLEPWQRDHTFGLDRRRAGERRTIAVVIITLAAMVGEIAAGLVFGSMALLADGVHMGSHALALGINAAAYVVARRRAGDPRLSFGTGKINALGGFTGGILLVVFALYMVVESAQRLVTPTAIAFDGAIAVAIIGLVVNLGCAFVLAGAGEGHTHSHAHGGHAHTHDSAHAHEHDHNLRSAYLHVLADALTSVLAIVALLGGKFMGAIWLDPVMGIVGAALIARWSVQLLREAGGVLLDREAAEDLRRSVRAAIEDGGEARIADLHLWPIGPGIHAAELVIVTHSPQPPEHYKARLPREAGIVHATVEVHRCPGPVPPG